MSVLTALRPRSAAAEERWATRTIEQKRVWIRAHTTAILVHPVGRGSFEPGVEIQYRDGVIRAE